MATLIDTTFPFWALYQRLDSGLVLAEALGFPEVSRLGADRRRMGDQLRRNVSRLLLEDTPLSALYRRHVGGEPAATTVAVPLDPVGPGAWWRGPLPLSFPVLTWDHGGAALAFVPALGIEVVADARDALGARLPTEIRAALARAPALTLPYLVGLQRVTRTRVDRLTVGVPLKSAKARPGGRARARADPVRAGQGGDRLDKQSARAGLRAGATRRATGRVARRPLAAQCPAGGGVGRRQDPGGARAGAPPRRP